MTESRSSTPNSMSRNQGETLLQLCNVCILFQYESGGTCLSTDWKDVSKKKMKVKPPDGMEFKKW